MRKRYFIQEEDDVRLFNLYWVDDGRKVLIYSVHTDHGINSRMCSGDYYAGVKEITEADLKMRLLVK